MGQTLPREFANDQCALRFLPGSRGHYGGLLALAAGYLVFLGTTRAAARQVAALTAQTEALRQQNRDLWSEGQQRQERDRIIATKLVASLLALIRNDVDNLKQLLDQPRYAGTNRIVPPNYRQQIYKPPLNIVWDDLGMCSPEIIGNYLQLDDRTCSSMPGYRNSRELRFMPSISCKPNCRSWRIFTRFWSGTCSVTPQCTTPHFRKARYRADLPQADGTLGRGYQTRVNAVLRSYVERAAQITGSPYGLGPLSGLLITNRAGSRR